MTVIRLVSVTATFSPFMCTRMARTKTGSSNRALVMCSPAFSGVPVEEDLALLEEIRHIRPGVKSIVLARPRSRDNRRIPGTTAGFESSPSGD